MSTIQMVDGLNGALVVGNVIIPADHAEHEALVILSMLNGDIDMPVFDCGVGGLKSPK